MTRIDILSRPKPVPVGFIEDRLVVSYVSRGNQKCFLVNSLENFDFLYSALYFGVDQNKIGCSATLHVSSSIMFLTNFDRGFICLIQLQSKICKCIYSFLWSWLGTKNRRAKYTTLESIISCWNVNKRELTETCWGIFCKGTKFHTWLWPTMLYYISGDQFTGTTI